MNYYKIQIMKKIKQTFIVWISIYPAITTILFFFGEELNKFPLLSRTFLLTTFLVPLMIFILVPFWTKVIDHFLEREPKPLEDPYQEQINEFQQHYLHEPTH